MPWTQGLCVECSGKSRSQESARVLMLRNRIKNLKVLCGGNLSALITGWEAETGELCGWSSEPASLDHGAVANSKETLPLSPNQMETKD